MPVFEMLLERRVTEVNELNVTLQKSVNKMQHYK